MKGLHLFSASIEINLRHQREGGSTGLVVIGGDSSFKGRGFESWHHILDGHFSHILVVKFVMRFV